MTEPGSPVWQPLRLPNGTVLPNRFVIAPMTTDSAQPDGTVSDEELRYVKRRCAAGEFAAGITSCAYVAEDGRAWQGIGAARAAHLDSLRATASAFRCGGSLAVLQLYDGGRIADPRILGPGVLRAPSAVASLRQGAPVPRALDAADVGALVDAFGDAARRGEEAGFDGIEIHGANHYLIHQFRSPRANHRTDVWAGDAFPLAVADAVRVATGSATVVGFRLNPFESEAGGFTLDDSVRLAGELSTMGLDYLHVSMDDFRRNNPQREDRDWTKAQPRPRENRSPLTAIADAVDGRCAVIASGGIASVADAEEALGLGADLVAVGRATLVDPDWLPRTRAGEPVRTHLPADVAQMGAEAAIPERMARYLLSRPGWIPVEGVPRG